MPALEVTFVCGCVADMTDQGDGTMVVFTLGTERVKRACGTEGCVLEKDKRRKKRKGARA